MPVTTTYPGVYIEERSSGVRTITGVATSIAAFLGRAAKGPVNRAVKITSYSDYERTFGGLSLDSTMSFAVRDFYNHGGSEAVIIRLFKPGDYEDGEFDQKVLEQTAKADIGVVIRAASPGSWGQSLRVYATKNGITQDVADRFKLRVEDLFNLVIAEAVPGVKRPIIRERILNLTTVAASERRVDRVLAATSQVVRSDEANGEAVDEAQPDDNGNPSFTPLTLQSDDPDGAVLTAKEYQGNRDQKTGLYALEDTDLFNILCIPPDILAANVPTAVLVDAMTYCAERRAMLIVDSPVEWNTPGGSQQLLGNPRQYLGELTLSGLEARNAVIYHPWVRKPNPLRENQIEDFPTCGIAAGRWAATDTTRGVWKAPAGIDVSLLGVTELKVKLTDLQNGLLNPVGINCLRSFPAAGKVMWGARTLRGDDQLADEYKYVPVRRLALFIEESLYRGTQFAVFEPNDEPLWAQLRLNIGAFMHGLFRQQAFQGRSPAEAYLVKCDKDTTTQNDINLGRVNVVVGFAPLKPAEFVIIQLQQLAGQIQV